MKITYKSFIIKLVTLSTLVSSFSLVFNSQALASKKKNKKSTEQQIQIDEQKLEEEKEEEGQDDEQLEEGKEEDHAQDDKQLEEGKEEDHAQDDKQILEGEKDANLENPAGAAQEQSDQVNDGPAVGGQEQNDEINADGVAKEGEEDANLENPAGAGQDEAAEEANAEPENPGNLMGLGQAQEVLRELSQQVYKMFDSNNTALSSAQKRYREIYRTLASEKSDNELLGHMQNVALASGPEKRIGKFMNPKSNKTSSRNIAIKHNLNHIHSIISDRLDKIAVSPSAGDEDNQNFIWGKVFVNNATQQNIMSNQGYKSHQGYTSNGWGLVLGFDRDLERDANVGIAASLIRNKLQYTNDANHTDKYNGFALSGYGRSKLTNKVFADAVVTYNNNNIEGRDVGIFLSSAGSMSKANYTASNWNAITKLGYVIESDNTTLKPIVGLHFTYFNSFKYSDKAIDGNEKIDRSVDSSTNFAALLGFNVQTKIHGKNLIIIPEIHSLAELYLAGKSSTINNSYNNLQLLSSDIPKPNNTLNLGTSISLNMQTLTLSFGYDVYLANGFIGQQGSLKMKVSF